MPLIQDSILVEGNLTATTISASTYLNLPLDNNITGGTVNRTGNLSSLVFTNNTGGTFTVSSIFDTFVTGGTYNTTGGTLTFVNNSGNTFNVTGLSSTDTFTTGFTYSNNVFTIARNQGLPSLTALINTMTGLTVNGNLTVTGTTTTGTISATTYQNLPTDIRVTGGTFVSSAGTATFTNNTGGTFNVTGFSSGVDTFTTAYTYSNNVFTIFRNQGQSDLTALINTMTGLTVNGNLTVTGSTTSGSLSATTISGGTFFGNASGLTNITAGAVEVSSSATSTTTSSTPVLIPSMSAMTTSNTFMAIFNGVFNSSNGSAVITISFFVNGIQLTTSARPIQFNNQTQVTIVAKIFAPVGATVEARWSTTGPGTATAINRSLLLV